MVIDILRGGAIAYCNGLFFLKWQDLNQASESDCCPGSVPILSELYERI